MKTTTRLLGPSLLLVGLGVSGCATTESPDATPASHDNMDAVLWLQTSTEYAAATTGLYASATAGLRELAAANPDPAKKMAVVLDIDETVLDNSRYQGQLIFDNARYESESWDRWIEIEAATAVPGVVDFITTAQSLGVHVAFITNRRCRERPGTTDACPQVQDTLDNLEAVGIDTSATTLFIRGDRPDARCRDFLTAPEREDGTWSSDKTSRRTCIDLDHDIVMLFGDQLGDFTEVDEDGPGPSGRELAAKYTDHWGKRWFMLPNPTYGGWNPNDTGEKRSRIRGIQ